MKGTYLKRMHAWGRICRSIFACLLILAVSALAAAQQIEGSITGTVKDASGAVVPDAAVQAENTATNLTVMAHTDSNGSYLLPHLLPGTYQVTMTKDGFQIERHSQVVVNADRTTTVDASLKVGQANAEVEVVTSTPLMNQVDTTNGYVVDQLTIQNTPLGTGSFTQLAILTPGVHADFLGGAGANAGLGNQAIFSNGQRDTSNSFSLNGVDTNNLFNGKSTSQVGENRFVLNTGENFGPGGSIQSVSVYGAIGQALPTPPPEAIGEVAVNAAMYDATQGAHSGAHISVVTKSGTNELHGVVYEKIQNSVMNAAPFFYNASPAITTKVPFLNRNTFGGNVGGPLVKNKLFYFGSYQGIRLADAANSAQDANIPLGLTNDRSITGIVNGINATYPTSPVTASQLSSAAIGMLQAQLPNGQYLIPTPQITNVATAKSLGYDVFLQGPNAKSSVDQGIGGIDYSLSDRDRLTARYYIQRDPTSTPFSAVSALLGFPQQLLAGSQVASFNNTMILGPSLTWTQRAGFTRLYAYSTTGQDFNPTQFGMSLLGSNTFPQMKITTAEPTLAKGLEFGPSSSFGNAGMYQNQWEYGTTANWVKGRHTLAFGMQWDHSQLNVINNNTNTDSLTFTTFLNFVKGVVRTGTSSDAFVGSASRYYRSDTPGLFVNDNFKLRSNLTLTLGLRWDYEGPLTEKYGKLTAFNPNLYSYDAASGTFANSGLEVAASSSDSLMTGRQWGVAPRLGVAWSPMSKLTVRTGFGIYYDRGEFFSEFSPSAGGGFNGPFGVTLAPPFVSPIFATTGSTLNVPFGTTPPPPPAGTAAAFTALLPNIAQTISGKFPAGNSFGPFLFGGYDPANTLPYTENWTLDLQYQASNNWLFSVGYVGNHGVHGVLPIPFNQPLIATAANPVNGQTASYGLNEVSSETVATSEFAGNAPVRVPFPGYDMNSVFYKAEGISNYHALQLQARKRLSNGLQFTGAYTWSHSLDEQSGLGLFFTGNNALSPKTNYASSDFDQTHVFLINYSYNLPKVTANNALGTVLNGWTIGGQTLAQSGQPYSVYDYTGSIASLYFGTDDEITNPIVPLKPGITSAQAQLQGTTGVNAGKPVLDVNAFSPQFVAPGTNGVPAGDIYESVYGNSGRNLFRAPFQTRFDMTLGKSFRIHERYDLRFSADAFNVFNHTNFDAPNNDVSFFPAFEPPPVFPPSGSLGIIQHTIGSPRFLQMSLHLNF